MPAPPPDADRAGANRLLFGCMGLGGGWNRNPISADDMRTAHAAIDAALEAGIDRFDHADIYTFGKAEETFGRVLRERPALRERVRLQSKCGIRFADAAGPKRYDLSAEWIRASVDGSLARLGVERIELLLLHRPDPLMEPEEIAAAFDALRAQGKVARLGVSNMHAGQMQALERSLPEQLAALQIELSLTALGWLEEGVLAGQAAGAGVGFTAGTLEHCRARGIEVQAWGALCQGRLSGRPLDGAPESVRAAAACVADLAARHGTSREAVVLGFLLAHPARVHPVIGTTDPERIAACAAANTLRLQREDWYRLYEAARGGELP